MMAKTMKTTFGKHSSRWMGSMALVAGAALAGCGPESGPGELNSLSSSVETIVDTLDSGQTLSANQQLVSANGKYRATMQEDGNFVVYRADSGAVVWAVNEYRLGTVTGWRLTMQSDGNLVVRTSADALIWQSGSFVRAASPGQPLRAFLKLDNFGGLTVYDGTPAAPGEKRWLSKFAKYEEVAKKFRPVFNLSNDQVCEPLTFRESDSGTKDHQDFCRTSYDSAFAVFASVADHPDDRPNSYRISYGVAFGWQSGTTGVPLDVPFPGAHGDDAQYLVVDVVDDRVIAVWADMHQGHYARTASDGRGLTMYNANQARAWVGQYYNSLKLLQDTTTACKNNSIDTNISMSLALVGLCATPCVTSNSCGRLETVLNWGDWVGSYHANQPGKLVMTDHACAAPTNTGYRSADGISYTSTQLAGLRHYIGCDQTTLPWDDGASTFRSKSLATAPYDLTGCDSGDAANGGDICNATHFPAGRTWQTSKTYKNLYLEPWTAGSADVDYTAGSPFNDIPAISRVPESISIRTGTRVDQVSVNYNPLTVTHGGSGGSAQTISSLTTDPVVAVELCDAEKDGRKRVGHVKFVTRSGRYMEGGNTYNNCRYLQPSGKRFYGFYGRSGGEVDVLGTIWGDL